MTALTESQATDTDSEDLPDNPAKFSKPIIDRLEAIVAERWRFAWDLELRVLDPFAGVGRIHQLDGLAWCVGVELQEKWARQSHGMVVGNSEWLPFRDHAFQLVITSCTYGNRMADHHNAMERCRPCKGTGCAIKFRIQHGPSGEEYRAPYAETCEKCDGKGVREYRRHTYTHYYGSPLHPRNAGRMQWGAEYRALHMTVWRECRRALEPGGLLLLNCSDHVREGRIARVVNWHRGALRALGFQIVDVETIPTRRNRDGANAHLRVDGEQIIIAQLKQ